MHRLLKRQLKKCTRDENIDIEKLKNLVSLSYEELDNTIKRIDRRASRV